MPKHYAIADIHGIYDIYEQVCDMLQPDDVVYFLGDAGDRGYANFKCIKAIYNNPQWVYLKGNHEDMMVKALRQKQAVVNGYMYDTPLYIWFNNGGDATFDEWIADGRDERWIARLDNLPLTAEYTNEKGIIFHMSHAGYTCGRKNEIWGEELLWSRSHFHSSWDEDVYPNDICIHGHTPIPYLIDRLGESKSKKGPEAKEYCNGHKIDIDNGVFYTNQTVLYDLDEMKAIPLYSKGE